LLQFEAIAVVFTYESCYTWPAVVTISPKKFMGSYSSVRIWC